MRLVMLLKKSIYPVLLVLLPLAIAGGTAGQAMAGTPAAKYIGVDAYSNPTWSQVGTPSSPYYLGQPQSEKFFYNNSALPSSDATTTYQYGIPGCGAKSGSSYVYPTGTLCIVVWNTAASDNGSDLQNFLESTLTDPHNIVMAFCNEPEIHQGSSGCVCDPSGTEQPCGGSSAFISQFETESNYITSFESANGASNVRVAEDSYINHYSGSPPDCSFTVPPQYVSYYLADVYEPNQTSAQNLTNNAGWNGWVTCTTFTGSGDTRGIAEYGIDCGNEQAEDSVVAGTFAADDAYLKANFPHLEVWNLWDDGGCAINSTDEPLATAAWQNIEAGN